MTSNQNPSSWNVVDYKEYPVFSEVLRKALDQNENIEYAVMGANRMFKMGKTVLDDIGAFRIDKTIIGIVIPKKFAEDRITSVYILPTVDSDTMAKFHKAIQNAA